MNSVIDKSAQVAMQKALEKYEKDKTTAKEFYPCSVEITSWLKKLEK
ncbi:hypothetical protein [Sulfurimonas sp.]